tara:strand:+ start:612 stop:1277 length:666 start_codon:yes stop_codon:yes gene_type:complete
MTKTAKTAKTVKEVSTTLDALNIPVVVEAPTLPVLVLAPIVAEIGAVYDIQNAATLSASEEAWKANRQNIEKIIGQMAAMIAAGAKTETVVNDFKAQFKVIIDGAGKNQSSLKALRAALNVLLKQGILGLVSVEVQSILEGFYTQEEFYASLRKPSAEKAEKAEPTTTERVAAIVEAIRLAGRLSESDLATVTTALKANQMTDEERAEAIAMAVSLEALVA